MPDAWWSEAARLYKSGQSMKEISIALSTKNKTITRERISSALYAMGLRTNEEILPAVEDFINIRGLDCPTKVYGSKARAKSHFDLFKKLVDESL